MAGDRFPHRRCVGYVFHRRAQPRRQSATFQADELSLFFIGLFTSTTYLLGGWAREQVCTYMCPWPRLPGAMIDEDSLVVTYESWRGEPRGPKRKSQDWDQRGDCIDCKACVHV